MSAPARPGEDDLIARWFRPLATDPGAHGLVDDCATLAPPPGCDLVLKTDAVAAGIHFFPDDPWDLVARKALRVNLSDLAAKGARPLGHLLSLALPADWREADLAAFAAGLADDQARYGLSLLGGDTIRSPAGLVVSITVFGAVPTGGMVRRAAARPGDLLYVSGTLGDAALGLALRRDPAASGWPLDADGRHHLARRYLLPEPRLALAPAVLAHARAAMDVSDGLDVDLVRMMRPAGLDAVIDRDRLPLSAAATAVLAADPARLDAILGGGDDYEILAAVAPENAAAFEAAARTAAVRLTRIGRCEGGEGRMFLVMPDGIRCLRTGGGFRHF